MLNILLKQMRQLQSNNTGTRLHLIWFILNPVHANAAVIRCYLVQSVHDLCTIPPLNAGRKAQDATSIVVFSIDDIAQLWEKLALHLKL